MLNSFILVFGDQQAKTQCQAIARSVQEKNPGPNWRERNSNLLRCIITGNI